MSSIDAVVGLPLKREKAREVDWKSQLRSLGPLAVLLICAVVFHWMSGEAFLTARNLSNLSRQVCVNLTLAVGMTLVILTAGIDLSVGSVLALAGMVTAITQVQFHWADWGWQGAVASLLAGVSVGGLCGGISGFAVSRLGITPFIVSLGMMVIARGLTLVISNAQAVAPLGETLGQLSSDYFPVEASRFLLIAVALLSTAYGAWRWTKEANKKDILRDTFYALTGCAVIGLIFGGYRGIPYMVFVAALCAMCGHILLKSTRFGRFLYAIGGNREAAELSGVPVNLSLWGAYLLMGLLAGLAGVLDSARVNGAVPTAGELAELDAIAAVVIGGTSLMGGIGTISGTLFGVLVLGVLNNGMSLIGVNEHYQKIFKGLVIITAVYLDLRAKKRR